ncbi:hypothetical protein [Actimicrobium sp. CCI2.3]|uniref:hypothetical protein n=1 Tax=Actimicrobium sp. CCI2.3 TaxID=3048616 RepID=UPI002AB413F2|nr:hypothetical protein [Actimicrobium sp. CCI2.3]MDY7574717.1 hypothetical protein [Actimicrobium sp. CCI2.3]MEB0020322.1 hypothetical protein [Actimicrobium sp. CCI2.3]
MKTILLAIAVLLSGCTTDTTYQRFPPQIIYEAPLPQQGMIVYSDTGDKACAFRSPCR